MIFFWPALMTRLWIIKPSFLWPPTGLLLDLVEIQGKHYFDKFTGTPMITGHKKDTKFSTDRHYFNFHGNIAAFHEPSLTVTLLSRLFHPKPSAALIACRHTITLAIHSRQSNLSQHGCLKENKQLTVCDIRLCELHHSFFVIDCFVYYGNTY